MPTIKDVTITRLLGWVCDPKSGLVQVARQELKRRFDYLSLNECCKVLNVLFQSGKPVDVSAACRMLRVRWIGRYLPQVTALWLQTHRPEAEILVVQHADTTFLREHLSEVSKYAVRACIRLCEEDATFVPDTTILSGPMRLYAFAKAEREVSYEETSAILYKTIADGFLQAVDHTSFDFADLMEREALSLRLFKGVNMVVWCLDRVGRRDVAYEYNVWEHELVQAACHEAPDLYFQNDTWEQRIDIFRKNIITHFPEPYLLDLVRACIKVYESDESFSQPDYIYGAVKDFLRTMTSREGFLPKDLQAAALATIAHPVPR